MSTESPKTANGDEPAAKKKRGADHQITKDDYEDEGDGDSGNNEDKLKQGSFARASEDVLAKRKIYKAKRTVASAASSSDKAASTGFGSGSSTFASATPAASSGGSSNPFASTVLASSSTEKAGSPAKKVFGFGSATGFGTATSGLSAGNGSSGFGGGGGFAGVGTSGKSSGFGSSSTGSTQGFVFGSSSNGSGTTKSLFGNTGASKISFSLSSSKKSDNSNDSSGTKGVDASKTTKLPDKVDLKTGEEDEEAIHSGRCKSFEWVVEIADGTDGGSADANDDGDDRTSPNKNKTNLSVQSSTQFQAAISSSSNGEDQNDNAKGSKSASDATPANGKHRWMELGIGPVKILRSKSNPERLRLVQRRESSKMGPATKVILNIPLWRESTCERDRQALQYLRLKTMKEGKMCQYSLKFKENADAGYFYHHLMDHIPLARQCFNGKAAKSEKEEKESAASESKE